MVVNLSQNRSKWVKTTPKSDYYPHIKSFGGGGYSVLRGMHQIMSEPELVEGERCLG